MTPYRPVAYQRRVPSPILGQTFDEMLRIPPWGGDVLRLFGHGLGSWFGIYIGTRPEMGIILRIVGWVMGSGMGIAAVLDLVSLGMRIAGVHPEPPPVVKSSG